MAFCYETHMHTSESSGCARNSAAEQVQAYKARGYAGIIITDHFLNGYTTSPKDLPWAHKMRYVAAGYQNALEEGERCGLDVFFGWEFNIGGSDLLTYGLDFDFLCAHPGLDKMPLPEYSALVRQNGGYLAQAHPYRDAEYIQHKLPVPPQFLDGVEVFNASDRSETNAKALAFAQKHGLAMQAGSDAHWADIAFPSGIKLAQRAKNIFDIIDALKAGRAELITPRGQA